jgi:limonene-1,2-epoxide hydrolase
MGFEVKFHRNVADGGTVLNERTDAMIFDRCACSSGSGGVFEVNDDGRITPWRDYFDFYDFGKADPPRDRRDRHACAAAEDVTGAP